MIVDNLHRCSNDLIAFLRNLFIRFKDMAVPVLCLTVSQQDEKNISPENQWLKYLDTIASSNRFRILMIPSLEKEDVVHYIKALVPGSSENVITLIEKNTFNNPFYIRLFIDYLKVKNVLKTSDGKFWWLEDTAALIDSQHLRSNAIDTLVNKFLEVKFKNEQLKQIASIVFLFNNSVNEIVLQRMSGLLDSSFLLKAGLFQGTFEEGRLVIKFSHDLFYYNFQNVIWREELILYASRLLISIKNNESDIKIIRSDVIGKLSEYTGLYEEAYSNYLNYAKEKYESAAFTSLIFYEKAFEMLLLCHDPFHGLIIEENSIAEVIYRTLTLYDQYNFLSARKSEQFFNLLQKFSDFKQLSKEQQLRHLYFLGLKFTKQEEFKIAGGFLKKAYEAIGESDNFPEKLIDSIVASYGINLKHIGKKEESMVFFETASIKWNRSQIQYQKYSNIAAYYLTIDPVISLNCYEQMQMQISPNKDLHLVVDHAMVNFYLKKQDVSLLYLNEAVILSRKKLDLSEEARAENILGVIYWQKNNLGVAEHYLDLALSNGELANNHRWIWRIRTNIAQVAFYNQNVDKSYNICWGCGRASFEDKRCTNL